MSKVKSIMIVGVGGQGSLLASKLAGTVLINCGYDVKVSEVHGMSQRGGSVVTYVKFGDKVNSPVVSEGEADYIVSFEALEAARWLSYLREGGRMIVNNQEISPMPVITGAMEYPQNALGKIREKGIKLIDLDALSLAEEAGSAKAVNLVLMGVLSQLMDIPQEAWQKGMEEVVPEKFLDMNKRAFELGNKKCRIN